MIGPVDRRDPPEMLDSLSPVVQQPPKLLLIRMPLLLGETQQSTPIAKDAKLTRPRVCLAMDPSQGVTAGVSHVFVRAAGNTTAAQPLIGCPNRLSLIRDCQAMVFYKKVLQPLHGSVRLLIHRENSTRLQVTTRRGKDP